MKKLVLLLMIMRLFATTAAAEGATTRTETVRIKDTDIVTETTYFESLRGYAIWIDTSVLTLQDVGHEDDVDRFTAVDGSGIEIDIFFAGGMDETLSEIAGEVMDLLLDNFGQVEELEASEIFSGYSGLGYASTHDGICVEHYLIEVAGSAFHIVMSYPEETDSATTDRVRAMLSSFELLEVESVG